MKQIHTPLGNAPISRSFHRAISRPCIIKIGINVPTMLRIKIICSRSRLVGVVQELARWTAVVSR
jgi:hypothetical protein